MKKALVALLAVVFMFSSQIPASAANKTVKGGKAVTITFPGTVTLKKSGCQSISVKYTVGKMPDLAFAALSILDDSDSPLGNSIFYKTPSFSDDGKVWKKNGSFNVKVCRSDWSEDIGDGEFQDYVGVKKGTYQIYLAVYPSTEEYSTITFK
jgi:hypothetical protein